MTGSARNESVPNGASSGHPRAPGDAIDFVELAAHRLGALEREQPGDRQRHHGLHGPVRDRDEAAAVLGQARAHR